MVVGDDDVVGAALEYATRQLEKLRAKASTSAH
jgi:hypothetical protein